MEILKINLDNDFGVDEVHMPRKKCDVPLP